MSQSFDLDAARRIALASVEQRLDAHFARDRAELEAVARAILDAGGRPGLEVALGCGRPKVVDLADPARFTPPLPVIFPDWQRQHAKAAGIATEEAPPRRLSLSSRFADLAGKTDERYAAAVVKILSSHNPILDFAGPARLRRRHWRARLADWARALADRIDP